MSAAVKLEARFDQRSARLIRIQLEAQFELPEVRRRMAKLFTEARRDLNYERAKFLKMEAVR